MNMRVDFSSIFVSSPLSLVEDFSSHWNSNIFPSIPPNNPKFEGHSQSNGEQSHWLTAPMASSLPVTKDARPQVLI